MTHAKHSLGQNFLIDRDVLAKIISASNLTPNDNIVEIGPGRGILTAALLEKAASVTAIELDSDLLPDLQNRFRPYKNFKLIHGNALAFVPPQNPYKLIANIPYYITSPILNHFLFEQFLQKNQNPQTGNPPTTLVLMMQREVAEKIMAKKEKHSVLSLEVHMFGKPEIIAFVPRQAFFPSPKVESAIIRITTHEKPQISGDLKKIMWLFHISFAQKRKKLCNNLAAALRREPSEIKTLLKSLNINEDIRAEDLTLEEWEKLNQLLNYSVHPAI
jgi:16S rRNA (adenine1518-N6/adenine1519-N6)-dimethyltransferase